MEFDCAKILGQPSRYCITACCVFGVFVGAVKLHLKCFREAGPSPGRAVGGEFKRNAQRAQKKLFVKNSFYLCPGQDSNLHTATGTTPSKWRVYQFHHLGNLRGKYKTNFLILPIFVGQKYEYGHTYNTSA